MKIADRQRKLEQAEKRLKQIKTHIKRLLTAEKKWEKRVWYHGVALETEKEQRVITTHTFGAAVGRKFR